MTLGIGSSQPTYSGIGRRVDPEEIAQCERCHAVSSVETGSQTNVVGFRVVDTSASDLLYAETAWRRADQRATSSGCADQIRAADRLRVRLYELRDAHAARIPVLRHVFCGGRVHIFTNQEVPT
jgi:hypothetical protein